MEVFFIENLIHYFYLYKFNSSTDGRDQTKSTPEIFFYHEVAPWLSTFPLSILYYFTLRYFYKAYYLRKLSKNGFGSSSARSDTWLPLTDVLNFRRVVTLSYDKNLNFVYGHMND